MLITHNPD